MNYQEFKNLIETFQIINKKEYKELISTYGEELINDLFDIYVHDTTIKDDKLKQDRTKVYLDLSMSIENEFEDVEEVDLKKLDDASLIDEIIDNFEKNSLNYYDDEILELDEEIEEDIEEDSDNDLSDAKILTKKYDSDNYNIDIVKQYLNSLPKELLTEEEEIKYSIQMNEAINNYKELGFEYETFVNFIKELGYVEKVTGTKFDKFEMQADFLIKYINDKELSTDVINKCKQYLKGFEYYIEYQKNYNEIFIHNTRLVVSIAKNHIHRDMEFLDIIDNGNEGLDRAIHRYDYTKENKFSTYATWWIRQKILRTNAESSGKIRIPVHFYWNKKKYDFIVQYLLNSKGTYTDEDIINYCREETRQELIKAGKDASDENVIKECAMTEITLQRIKKSNFSYVSMDLPIGEKKDSTYKDFIKDDKVNVDDDYIANDTYNNLVEIVKESCNNNHKDKCNDNRDLIIAALRLNILISKLISKKDFIDTLSNIYDENNKYYTKEQLSCLYDYYIRNYQNTYVLEHCGELFGITRERVRQIDAKLRCRTGRKIKIRGLYK